jgi:hypothetical protein
MNEQDDGQQGRVDHDESTAGQAPTRRGPVERDPRFPSGEWKGFWVQRGMPGRQWMRLALEFNGGAIAGEGRDIIGPFVLAGSYDLKSGRCTLLKRYVNQHAVAYEGFNDGDGLWLWGTWKLPDDSGGFHLWPKGEADPTGSTLSQEAEIPVDDRELVLVGVGVGDDTIEETRWSR